MSPDANSPGEQPTQGVKGILNPKRLVPGERVLWEGRPAAIIFLLRPVILVVLGAVYALLALDLNGQITSRGTYDWIILLAAFAVCILMIPLKMNLGIAAGAVGMIITFLVWGNLMGPYILAVMLPALIGLISFGVSYLSWSHIVFAMTDRRIIAQYGIFSLTYGDTNVDKVQNVTVSQPLLERILGYGDVMFNTSGERGGVDWARRGIKMSLGGSLTWEDVPHPFEVRRKAEEIITNRSMPSYQPLVPTPPPRDASTEEKLQQLNSMKEKGLVSDAEYEEKRMDLLKRM
jgi:hypothetical protein